MAAKDYKICLGWRNAYIGKCSKRNKNTMTEDRRVLSEGEILSLIHWWTQKKAEETGEKTQSITVGDKVVVEVTLLEENKKEEI